MNSPAKNPFNVTKAVDFSDQEISDYWVDMPSGTGFAMMAKPTSPMPMLILGGKGSGKTHLMRYFSFPLQCIRNPNDLMGGIQQDGYIGIYLRCGGLNSARFKEKGQSEETWADVFAYYMELWLAQLLLDAVLHALHSSADFEDWESDVVKELAAHIQLREHESPRTLRELCSLLKTLQLELDSAVNNASLTRQLPVRIAVTRGDLIFGIPKVLASHVETFRECAFLYLIDEFENLSEQQQKYVNTLVRERRPPSTFKIGARMYGVRTYSTYSADEENKEGSEFEVLRLDSLLRNNPQYPEFARQLIAKRVAELNRIPSDLATLRGIAEKLDDCFEEPAKSRFAAGETEYVITKYRGRERPYFKTLRQQLERGLRAGAVVGVEKPEDVTKIIEHLTIAEFPLLEKCNTFLLYKEWSSRSNLMKAAAVIASECRQYLGDMESSGRYQRALHHFKADLLAQLLRETDQRQRYVGLATFIEISSGLPRNLLILLKHVYAWATFSGERPFNGDRISMKSQQAGVMEASDWFFRDARMIGRDGEAVMASINRLGTLFRGVRFSDKPSECSCSTFSSDVSQPSSEAKRILDLAQKWSLLIDVGTQKDRNTDRIDAKIQLNRMLAPRWDLAIFRRGVLALTSKELDAIFDPAFTDEFDELLKRRVRRMTAPTFGKDDPDNKEVGEDDAGLFPDTRDD